MVAAAPAGRRRNRFTRRMLGFTAAAMTVGFVLGAGQLLPAPAHAVDASLPTWDEVQAAKQNQATADAKVTEIEGLLAQSQKDLERLRNESAAANQASIEAEAAFQEQAQKTATLEAEAEKSKAEADEAAEQASTIVAQMYRSGGVDRNMSLFLETDGSTADQLLDRMASMSKATERNTSVSEQAEQAMNTASSLGKQAEEARKERERLSADAQQKAETAAQAAATQQEKVDAELEQQKVLQTQLEALKDKTTTTVAGYQERLRQEEADRQAAIAAAQEAARRAAEEAAQNGGGGSAPPPAGGGGGGGSGWLTPTTGYYISTLYWGYYGHTGIDLATACWTPVVAPRGGTVTFVGWKDNFGGNMIHIDHGGGVQTRYAHLYGFNVQYGQGVGQGQVIGFVGTTGNSTGCHLHYEVLINGSYIDPLSNGYM